MNSNTPRVPNSWIGNDLHNVNGQTGRRGQYHSGWYNQGGPWLTKNLTAWYNQVCSSVSIPFELQGRHFWWASLIAVTKIHVNGCVIKFSLNEWSWIKLTRSRIINDDQPYSATPFGLVTQAKCIFAKETENLYQVPTKGLSLWTRNYWNYFFWILYLLL